MCRRPPQGLGNCMDTAEVLAPHLIQALQDDLILLRYIDGPEKLFVIMNRILFIIVDRALLKQLHVCVGFARQ